LFTLREYRPRDVAKLGFKDAELTLQRLDRARVQAQLEVLLVDTVMKGRDVEIRHAGNCSFPRPWRTS